MGAMLGQLTYEEITCCNCMVPFAVSDYVYRELKRTHNTFYCPVGHAQHFTGESEVEKLKRELQSVKSDATWYKRRAENAQAEYDGEKRSHAATKGKLTRIKNRAAHGVCPCCNRYFANMDRHMTSKHPDYQAVVG